jgi:hypothetical protein
LREAVLFPQRLRPLGAAKCVERVGSDAGAFLGPGVIPSKSLVVGGESGLADGERFGRLAIREEKAGQSAARDVPGLQHCAALSSSSGWRLRPLELSNIGGVCLALRK